MSEPRLAFVRRRVIPSRHGEYNLEEHVPTEATSLNLARIAKGLRLVETGVLVYCVRRWTGADLSLL